MTDNMKLWDAVCTTDPDSTKNVNVRGGFTAIDAMSQIQSATEQFGAAGEGWGWCYSEPLFLPNDTVVIKCTLWHGDRNNTIEQFGQKKMGSQPDEDALKKAATDGLTKCLSYLGFNADVFLGKFDDNKYVAALKKEKAVAVEDIAASYSASKDKMRAVIESCEKIENLKGLRSEIMGGKIDKCKLNGADTIKFQALYKKRWTLLAEYQDSDNNPLIEG